MNPENNLSQIHTMTQICRQCVCGLEHGE